MLQYKEMLALASIMLLLHTHVVRYTFHAASEMIGNVNFGLLTRIPYQHVVMRLLLVLLLRCADATSAAGGRRRNTWPAGCVLYRRYHDSSRHHTPASFGVRSSPLPPALQLSMHPKVATLHTVDMQDYISGCNTICIDKKHLQDILQDIHAGPAVRMQLYFITLMLLVIARHMPVHLQTRCACRQPEAGGRPWDATLIAIPHRLLRPASRFAAPMSVESEDMCAKTALWQEKK